MGQTQTKQQVQKETIGQERPTRALKSCKSPGNMEVHTRAWGCAGIIGNQVAIKVSDAFGGYSEGGHGYIAVVTMLVIVYSLNILNVLFLRRKAQNQ